MFWSSFSQTTILYVALAIVAAVFIIAAVIVCACRPGNKAHRYETNDKISRINIHM